MEITIVSCFIGMAFIFVVYGCIEITNKWRIINLLREIKDELQKR